MKCDKCGGNFPKNELKHGKPGAYSAEGYYCDNCYTKQREKSKKIIKNMLIGLGIFFVVAITFLLFSSFL